MKYLSHVISSNTPTYGGKDLCKIKQVKKIGWGDSSNNSQLHISSHVGTHIDAPYHFCKDGETIENFSPKFWFCNHPHLIDIYTSNGKIIKYKLIKDLLELIPEPTDILFIRTGFEKARDNKNYIFNNPGIEAEIGYWLRENRSIKMIGLDFISLSSYRNRAEGRRAHKAFLCSYEKNGISFDPIIIIEDMKLSEFHEKLKNICVCPLRIKNGDGAPVTVLAWQ